MNALRDIQASFIHDIYSGDRSSLDYLDAKSISSARLEIYKNNLVFGLTDILANAYPVLKKIVGDDFFKTIARHYIKSHPQPSGNRHTFGGHLSSFLRGFEPAATLPYLPDIASLEWAFFQAGFAEDADVIDFGRLMEAIALDPDFILKPHPGVNLVVQSFNGLAIWQEHQKEDPDQVQLSSREHALMIWRTQDDAVLICEISRLFQLFLESCKNNISFAQAMVVVERQGEPIDVFQKEFAQAVSFGVFTF